MVDRRAFLGILAVLGVSRRADAQPAGQRHQLGFSSRLRPEGRRLPSARACAPLAMSTDVMS